MSSSLALRNELVASIVRGFQRLRSIEWAAELAEAHLLEARKVYLAALDEPDDAEWAPDPDEIEAACLAIQVGWDEVERERRWRFERRDADAIKEWNDYYYATHREQILERNRDPEVARRRAEYQREYRERCKAQLKERRHAKRAHEYALQNERRRRARAARKLGAA